MRVVTAIWHAGSGDETDEHHWDRVRNLHLDKKALQEMAKKFKVEGAIADDGAPGCLPELPCGPVRYRDRTPLRVVPDLSEIAWFMQSAAAGARRPWVHFAASMGEKPYCRRTKFRRDPALQGKGGRRGGTYWRATMPQMRPPSGRQGATGHGGVLHKRGWPGRGAVSGAEKVAGCLSALCARV